MIKLYLSEKIFDKHCCQDSALGCLIRNPDVQLYLDLDYSKIIEKVNRQLDNRFIMANNDLPEILSGEFVMDQLRNGCEISFGLSKAIFIFESKDIGKTEEEIQKKYGVLCIILNNSDDTKHLNDKLNLLTAKSDKTVSPNVSTNQEKRNSPYIIGWKWFFSPFNNIPCNTFVFSDHYIQQDKKFYNNVKHIIAHAIENYHYAVNLFYVIFIVGHALADDRDHKTFHTANIDQGGIAAGLKNALSELSKRYKIRFIAEFVYCDNTTSGDFGGRLYNATHDRYVFSNYFNVETTKSLAAFNYNREHGVTGVKEQQRIKVSAIFKDGFERNEYVESEENSQETYLDAIVEAVGGWINPVCEGNNRLSYSAYQIENGETTPYNNKGNKVQIQNRLIMDKVQLIPGERCYYLSVPHCNNWAKIQINGKTSYYSDDGRYENCVVIKSERRHILEDMAYRIQRLFKKNNDQQFDCEQFYRIKTSTASDIRTLEVVASPKKELNDQLRNYTGNYFANIADAMTVVNKICEIIGEDKKYQEEEEIKNLNEISKRGYFFNPWYPNPEMDLFGKRVLVVDTSHCCLHSPKISEKESCDYFCECTNCFASLGNSMKFNISCPFKETAEDKSPVCLEDTTIYKVQQFLNTPQKETNNTYYRFTSFMQEFMRKKTQELSPDFAKELWNNIAYVNFGQNFSSQCSNNNFSETDFQSLQKYIAKIKPERIIVWGDVGEYLKKLCKDTITEMSEDKYFWELNGNKYLHMYHPAYNNFKDGGKLNAALKKFLFDRIEAEDMVKQIKEILEIE